MREPRYAEIGEQLLQIGVAPRHVRRILFELQTHLQDLREELEGRGLSPEEIAAEATDRLRADAVVEAARERPELRSWMRRWPLAAFTILPLFVYGALFAGGLALVVLCVSLAKHFGFPVENSALLQDVVSAIMEGLKLLLPASVAITWCIVASSRRAPLLWTLAGAALVSLLGATTNAQLELPPLVSRPALGAGLGFSTESFGAPLLRAASTFLVVLLPYLWHTRMQRRTV